MTQNKQSVFNIALGVLIFISPLLFEIESYYGFGGDIIIRIISLFFLIGLFIELFDRKNKECIISCSQLLLILFACYLLVSYTNKFEQSSDKFIYIYLLLILSITNINSISESYILEKIKITGALISIIIISDSIFFGSTLFTYSSTSTIGNYMCIIFPISFYKISTKIKTKDIILVILMYISIIITKDINSILISTIIIIIYFNHFSRKCFIENGRYVLVFLIFCSLIIATIKPVDDLPGYIWGRLFIQNLSTKLLIDTPLLGIGWGNFSKIYNIVQYNYFSKIDFYNKFSFDQFIYPSNVHWVYNEYLRVLIESGIIGFSIFICLLSIYLERVSRLLGSNEYFILLYLSLFSFLILAIVDNTFQISVVYPVIIIVVLKLSTFNRHHFKINLYFRIISILLLIFFLFFDSYYMSKWVMARFIKDKQMKHALYEESYRRFQYNGPFMYEYGVFLYKNGYHSESKKVLEKCKNLFPNTDLFMILGDIYWDHYKYYSLAEKNYKIASYMVPVKLLPRYKLFMLYSSLGKYKRAYDEAKVLTNIPLKVKSSVGSMIKEDARQYRIDFEKGIIK